MNNNHLNVALLIEDTEKHMVLRAFYQVIIVWNMLLNQIEIKKFFFQFKRGKSLAWKAKTSHYKPCIVLFVLKSMNNNCIQIKQTDWFASQRVTWITLIPLLNFFMPDQKIELLETAWNGLNWTRWARISSTKEKENVTTEY